MIDEDDAPEWSDKVFNRAEIRKGSEIIKPATGTLTKSDNQTEGWTGRKCPTCKGHGVLNDEITRCNSCGGTGDEYGVLDIR